jgi:Tol biopolymer transport system component
MDPWRHAREAARMNAIRVVVGLVLVLLACGKDSTAPTAPVPGSHVAFLATTRDAKTSLGVVNADGSGLAWLASDTWWYLAFSWSPDGARIAFGGGHDPASIGLYVVNADGTGLLRLTMDPEWAGIGVSNVAWSPDGSKIAFVGVNGPLEVVDADGTDRITIADVCKVWPPDPISWSPDGKKIAYCASPPDGGSEVYVSNANGSGQTRLTYGSALGSFPGSAPNWSPDGSKLAYQRETATPYPGTTYPKWDVHVINADGSGDVTLTEKLPGGLYPVWSPVGARLAFWSISDGAPNEIYVMNADGSGLVPVTAGASYDQCRYISWSADGTRLAYCAHDDVYSVGVDGGGVSNLTNDALFEGEPRWSPGR